MFRPGTRYKADVIFTRVSREEETDERGNPLPGAQTKQQIVAEVYPNGNLYTRQAYGLIGNDTRLIVCGHVAIVGDEVVTYDGNKYRIVEATGYDPMQILVAKEG